MANKKKNYKENLSRVGDFGKDLTRRSKAKCELCNAGKVHLTIFEVPPVPKEPTFDKCIFICDHCLNIINNIDNLKENDLRFLEGACWSETLIVKATAIAMLKIYQEKYLWIEEFLDDLYIEEEIKELIEQIKF